MLSSVVLFRHNSMSLIQLKSLLP